MRGLTHRWIPPDLNDPGGSPESGVATATVGAARLEPLVARVLLARGKRTDEEIAAFCHPRLTDLHDPALLPDIDKAAQRLLHALSAGEPIVIYGDYDVDGMTATAILFHTMRAIAPGAPVSTYVPHRLDEGYGLHSEAIEQLAREGARVVVSVDCGVTAFEPATLARRLGLDLIITDHHNLAGEGAPTTQGDEQLPDAFAVVHPRRMGSAYPFPDLCGAAVAFKLAWRMATTAAGGRVGDAMRSTLLDMLALAALGTIADIVPLVGENRLIARHGLARLRSTGLQGLATLIEVSGLAGENIDAEHVGFWLGPRLNACGRMGHAREAVELLTTAPPDEARRIATKLTALNEDRQKTERAIFEQACEMAERAGMTGADRRAIVLAHESWHAGVVGIVCSKLVGRYHRPTLLMQMADGHCHGSGRSIDGFNLHAALAECSSLLERFGGHDMAAGLGLSASNLSAFADAFIEVANAKLHADDLVPSLRYDCPADVSELTPLAVEQLSRLGPFGRGNPTPRVVVRDVRVARTPERFGARGAHASVHVRAGQREMRLVGWRWGERIHAVPGGAAIDAIVEPRLNVWNGRVRVEPVLLDLAVRND